jgi:Tol biopolymer transport system component
MTNLDERFRSLMRTPAPDLWPEIGERESRVASAGSVRRRALAAAAALLVAVGGFSAAVLVLGRLESRQPAATTGARIVFAAVGDETWQIFSVLPDGTDLLQLTDVAAPFVASDPAWSPDGTRVAYVVRESDTDRSEIWVMNADGSDAHPVIDSRGSHGNPAWSPDGSQIAYTAYGEGGGIYVAPVDGEAIQRLTSAGPPTTHVDSEPEWSSDGQSIVFIRWRLGDVESGNDYQILRIDAAGGEPVVLSRFEQTGRNDQQVRGLSWSPDGSRLAFTTQGGVYLLDPSGGDAEQIVPCDVLGCDAATEAFTDATSWSPDGTEISFTAQINTRAEVEDLPTIYVAMLSEGAVTVTSTGVKGVSPAWQPVVDEETEPSPSPATSTLRAVIAATIPIGEDVRSVVYGAGSVWVAVPNNDGTVAGRILRINPTTNEVVAEIPVQAIPGWEFGGGAMVVYGDSLWVTGHVEAPGNFESPGGGSDAAVTQIDVTTNEVVDLFTLGGTGGADLTFLDGELWVLAFGDESVDGTMEVVRINPSTGSVMARMPLRTHWAHTIAAAAGRLHVIEYANLSRDEPGGQMTSIDPAIDGITSSAEIRSEYSAIGPVVWRDEVWAWVDGSFARFDARTGEVIDRSPDLDPRRLSLGRMTTETDDRGIWFLGYNGVEGSGPVRLALFDPATDAVTELVPLGDENPIAMAVAPESVWILNNEGTITRVDLISS